MILVNTDYITGKKLEMLGLVRGSTIQSKNIGKDITQSFKIRDYYLLDVGNRGLEVTLTVIADGSSFACILYDSAFRELDRAYDNPRFNVEPIDGSCHLCVENAGRAGGDYLLSIARQDD